MILGLLGIFIILLQMLGVVDVLIGRKSIRKKILWILFIVLFPVIGSAIYALAGRQDVTSPPLAKSCMAKG